jgi:8-hydroxy-5-deazaflavin:NADPH oxidoreductase
MKIGVIGTGNMGGGLARAFSRSHQVTIGSRDPEKARERAAGVGAAAGGGYQEALVGAEVVVLAIP